MVGGAGTPGFEMNWLQMNDPEVAKAMQVRRSLQQGKHQQPNVP